MDETLIADFEKWIAMGLPDPRNEPPSSEELTRATSWEATLQRRKQWWSLQPLSGVSPPSAVGANDVDHPIDRFVADELPAHGLSRAAPASPTALVRRLHETLLGLPPSYEEANEWSARIDAAVPSDRQLVVEELVDQLLDRAQFGERWARHWMDWIRYAESHGSEGDPPIDNAWMYRDYLIRALNDDVPYDQLVREHVAGDLLERPRINTELGINESKIGPAHWRMVFHGFCADGSLGRAGSFHRRSDQRIFQGIYGADRFLRGATITSSMRLANETTMPYSVFSIRADPHEPSSMFRQYSRGTVMHWRN